MASPTLKTVNLATGTDRQVITEEKSKERIRTPDLALKLDMLYH